MLRCDIELRLLHRRRPQGLQPDSHIVRSRRATHMHVTHARIWYFVLHIPKRAAYLGFVRTAP
ncbi:protein of unknown function [Methylorubrum extorquens]|uniref:Uncharacterized protein n=1 Tax=Methylorubrum extorquens TaxID=408 RepID=A0A2N9AVX2_METEX|nr:protein of unknown function [Methylorubrum extorquens]